MKLLIHSQTSMVQLLKFGNGQVISSHTLQGMWLIIHGSKHGPRVRWYGFVVLCFVVQGLCYHLSLIHVIHLTLFFRASSQYKDCLTSIGISMLKIRRSRNHLIFNMGIPVNGKTVFILRGYPGGCVSRKMLSYQYRDPHVKDKTVSRLSYL